MRLKWERDFWEGERSRERFVGIVPCHDDIVGGKLVVLFVWQLGS